MVVAGMEEKLVGGASGLLLLPQLEVLGALEHQLLLGLAFLALQAEHHLLGGLRLLVENRLGLPTVARLLVVVTALALSEVGSLAGLVLAHLVDSVLAALFALAVGPSFLGDVHHLAWR